MGFYGTFSSYQEAINAMRTLGINGGVKFDPEFGRYELYEAK